MKRPPQLISIQYYASPCGELILASIDEQLCLCDWNEKACAERNKRRLQRLLNATFVVKTSSVIESARLQLDQYFAGKRKTFDMPLLLVGTNFQQSVWKALLRISYGKTLSYKEVAQNIGNPKGVRAVAQAIGANGISIFIPCHRVIGSNRSFTGYAGGVEAKVQLLEIEKGVEQDR
uniref:methylated-DNA--[protein]-cysteine S-methyltransferase n=1 Tax=Alloprevotella sp. TaxID=1872471 RepID=UPI003FEF057A